MHDCRSNYITSFYGAFIVDSNICICTEFMDKGSFDCIYKTIGAIDINVVGKVALVVLEALTYLFDVHRIIHRDIKPSNVMCNSQGQIKIRDLSACGEIIGSVADTFVRTGTSAYVSPEQLQGYPYTIKSDVWSLGISLIELALGRFPFAAYSSDGSDLRNPGRAPKLTPEGQFPKEAEEFIDSCLVKDPDVRTTSKDLLKHPWIGHTKASTFDLEGWANTF